MANNTLLLGGVVLVGWWYWKKNNGAGFQNVTRSTGLSADPSSFNLSNIQHGNWVAQWNDATPQQPSDYAINQMARTGYWHL